MRDLPSGVHLRFFKNYIVMGNKSKIIGFRPSPRQAFELENICRELGVKKSSLIRFLIENFINKYEYEKLDKVQEDAM